MTNYHYHHENYGHFLRRLIHLSNLVLPILYYWYANSIAVRLHLSVKVVVGLVILVILILEIIRLILGIRVPGQRDYEITRISGFTWGSIGIAAVFLWAPEYGYHNAAYGLPIIWAWVFGDPLIGEARRLGFMPILAIIAGAVVISAVWVIAALWLNTPFWIIPVVVLVTLLAEVIKIPYIDDNFTMLIFPLVIIRIFQ